MANTKYEQNRPIFQMGAIVPASKMEVITIGLGRGRDISDLTIMRKGCEEYKVFCHTPEGDIVVATKEHPEGDTYDGDRTVVVRVLGGQVFLNGLYDLYCPEEERIAKLLGNPFKLDELLTQEQLDELEPVLLAGSVIKPSLAPEEPGRRVIQITPEMVGADGTVKCQCPWDPEGVLTDMEPGDFFLVQDEATFKGYRIGKEEFEMTHKLD